MISDEEIRAAFQHVVSRAPGPAGIQARLAARARAHRQRRALLATGGAVGVAAAIGVPGALLWKAHTGSLPFLGPGPDDVRSEADVRTPPNLAPAPAPPTAAAGNLLVFLRYGPNWMLEGYVECSREVSLGGPTYEVREWRPAAASSEQSPFIRVMLAPETLFPIGDWRRQVTVNGVPAWLSPKIGQFPQVIWSVGDGLNLSVSAVGVGDDSRVAQWVARSIGHVDTVAVEIPVRFGWLPDVLRGGLPRVSLTRDGDTWVAEAELIVGTMAQVQVALGPAVKPFPGTATPARLRERPGVIGMTSGGVASAYVELDLGLRVSVLVTPRMDPGVAEPGASPGAPIAGRSTPMVSTEELVRIVDELSIGSAPFYLGWLGAR